MSEFFRAYVEAALWSSVDESGEPLDAWATVDDIASETLRDMARDCLDFQRSNRDTLAAAREVRPHWLRHHGPGQAGHDFWLTRNHHGAGFWDRGLGELGDRLTDMAHPYGSVDLYVGDDGLIYA